MFNKFTCNSVITMQTLLHVRTKMAKHNISLIWGLSYFICSSQTVLPVIGENKLFACIVWCWHEKWLCSVSLFISYLDALTNAWPVKYACFYSCVVCWMVFFPRTNALWTSMKYFCHFNFQSITFLTLNANFTGREFFTRFSPQAVPTVLMWTELRKQQHNPKHWRCSKTARLCILR